jgi:hypothetical protein
MVVVPSRCTVLIQNVLLVDWFGVTVTTVLFVAGVVVLLLALCANAVCHVWLCIPRIIAANMITITVVAAAIIIEGFVGFLFSSNFCLICTSF